MAAKQKITGKIETFKIYIYQKMLKIKMDKRKIAYEEILRNRIKRKREL